MLYFVFLSTGNDNQTSVFKRHGLLKNFLPRGCHTVLLAQCSVGIGTTILLSSTSPWYQLNSNPTTVFTLGIVFVEVDVLALPISLTGVEIRNVNANFEILTGSLALSPSDGTPIGNERQSDCWSFTTTPADIYDFLTQNSFISTLFYQLEALLPEWLTFHPNGITVLGINDLITSLELGSEIQTGECQGAPLYPGRLYSVFRFGADFELSIYGQHIELPKPIGGNRFCLIVDICQDYGGSIFLMLPEGSRDLLDDMAVFQSLIEKHGLHLRPYGIGLSLLRHINVQSDSNALQLWNGDELFQYP